MEQVPDNIVRALSASSLVDRNLLMSIIMEIMDIMVMIMIMMINIMDIFIKIMDIIFIRVINIKIKYPILISCISLLWLSL